MSAIRSTASLLALLFLLPLGVRAAEPPDWVRDAPGRADYPLEEALCLRRHVKVELLPDGRCRRRVLTAVKVLQPIPFNRIGLGDPRVHFDAENQEIRVLQARTWLPSGRAIDTGANGRNVVFPDALAQAPDLARFRDLVVTHLGIQEGAVALLEYEIEDRRPPAWPCEGGLETQLPMPTLELLIELSAPREAGLQAAHLAPAGRRLAIETGVSEGRIRLAATGRAVPAAPRQSDLLVYGTRSWEELETLLAARRGAMGPLPETLAGAVAAAAGGATALARADAVSRILEEGLTLVAWPPELLGLQIRPAQRIWRSTYATPLEAAALLAACLEKAGLAEVRLRPVVHRPALAVPCLALAEEFWVSAALPGEPPLWIQAGGRPGAPEASALAGKTVLLGEPPDQTGEEFAGRLALAGTLSIGPDGTLEGRLQAELSGAALGAVQAALHGLEPQLLALARCLGGSGLVDPRIQRLDRAGACAAFSLKGATLQPAPGGLKRLVLALPPGSPAGLAGLHLEQQAEPIQVGLRRESLDLALRLPEGWRLAAGFPALESTCDLGRVRVSCREESGTVRIGYLLELTTARVEPEQWPRLRALLAPLRTPAAWTLLLAPAPSAGAQEVR